MHVPFNEHDVLLIVIKSTRPGCIHTPTNGAEIKQVGNDEGDERPRTDRRKDNRS
jgi:hypothetical protein